MGQAQLVVEATQARIRGIHVQVNFAVYCNINVHSQYMTRCWN